jgi:hypothetical protein
MLVSVAGAWAAARLVRPRDLAAGQQGLQTGGPLASPCLSPAVSGGVQPVNLRDVFVATRSGALLISQATYAVTFAGAKITDQPANAAIHLQNVRLSLGAYCSR